MQRTLRIKQNALHDHSSDALHAVRIENRAIRRPKPHSLNFTPAPLFYLPICYLATPLAVYARLFF